MRFSKWMGAAALVAGLAMAIPAEAGTTGTIKLARDTSGTDAYARGAGGEFRVTSFTGMALPPVGNDVSILGSPFSTFCIEYNEYVSFGKTYDWSLNTAADNGGVSGGNPDPVDARTAYLYTQFWNGTLSNYAFDDLGDQAGERGRTAGQLQNAIWFLEGEIGSLNAGSQAAAWVQEAQNAIDNGDWSGIGNVRVLNLTYVNSNGQTIKAQDQLVMIVPLPPAAMAGFMLLGGLGIVRRRRRKKLALAG